MTDETDTELIPPNFGGTPSSESCGTRRNRHIWRTAAGFLSHSGFLSHKAPFRLRPSSCRPRGRSRSQHQCDAALPRDWLRRHMTAAEIAEVLSMAPEPPNRYERKAPRRARASGHQEARADRRRRTSRDRLTQEREEAALRQSSRRRSWAGSSSMSQSTMPTPRCSRTNRE